jgi:DNA-binding NarL/FixJ family response regulator
MIMNAKNQLTTFCVVARQPSLCQLLTAIFSRTNGFHFLGAYPSASEALEQIPLANPDLVMMDALLPDLSVIETIPRFKTHVSSKIILLFAPPEPNMETFCDALSSGADGMLSQPPNAGEYLAAAKRVLENRHSISPAIIQRVMSEAIPDGGVAAASPHFTPAENKILELTSRGMPDKEIADSLGITEGTVGWHFRNLFSKLGVHNRCAAVAIWLNPVHFSQLKSPPGPPQKHE